MGVKYILLCVRKHDSKLPNDILTRIEKKNHFYRRKPLPYFMSTAFCVSFRKVRFHQWCVMGIKGLDFFLVAFGFLSLIEEMLSLRARLTKLDN